MSLHTAGLFYPGTAIAYAYRWTIAAIKHEMKSSGSPWWDRASMRFFNTRVVSPVIQGPGGVFFVTREHMSGAYLASGRVVPASKPAYTVRRYNPPTNDLDTVGEFNKIETKAEAVALARKLAKGGV